MSCGSINQAGILNGFFRKGLNRVQCMHELIANAIDAKATSIQWVIDPDAIYLVDNGIGLSPETIPYMFDLHRENHTNEETSGVSGFGAKGAMAFLSGKRDMWIETRTETTETYHITIPWEKMYTEKIYNDKISFQLANREKETSGTIIYFPYDEELVHVIRSQFENMDPESIVSLFDRTSIVFGEYNGNISLIQEDLEKPMKLYRYFYEKADYYTDVQNDTITVWKHTDNNYRYLFDNDTMEIAKWGTKGYRTKLEKVKSSSMKDWIRVGTMTFTLGLKVDPVYMDFSRPSLPGAGAYLSQEDFPFIGQQTQELSKTFLKRNGQIIGGIKTVSQGDGNERGSGKSKLASLIHSVLSYTTLSQQMNPLDQQMNIQENKNQYVDKDLPEALIRGLKQKRAEKVDQIWDNFIERTKPVEENPKVNEVPNEKPKKVPKEVPNEVPEEEVPNEVSEEEPKKKKEALVKRGPVLKPNKVVKKLTMLQLKQLFEEKIKDYSDDTILSEKQLELFRLLLNV